MHVHNAVVLNKPQLLEMFHENINARASCAYHLSQCFLAYLQSSKLAIVIEI